MSTINSVNNNLSTLTQPYSTVNAQENTQTPEETTTPTAPVDTVEISSKTNTATKKPTVDMEAIQKAIRESEEKMAQFKSLVEKLFQKQGKVSFEADWDTLAEAGKLGEALSKVEVDAETKGHSYLKLKLVIKKEK